MYRPRLGETRVGTNARTTIVRARYWGVWLPYAERAVRFDTHVEAMRFADGIVSNLPRDVVMAIGQAL